MSDNTKHFVMKYKDEADTYELVKTKEGKYLFKYKRSFPNQKYYDE